MASFAASARPKAAHFICDSCLSKLRPTQSSRLHSVSLAQIPPSSRYTATSRCNSSRALQRLPPAGISVRPATRSACATRPRRRTYSNATTTLPIEAARKGIAPLPHRRLVQLSGADAAKFLQGLITNNVDPSKSDSFYAAFLDARGRVLWDVFIWVDRRQPGEWACYVEVDGTEVESLMKHLKRHKLRSKVKFHLVPEDSMHLYASWGKAQSNTSPLFSMTDPRASGFGERFLSIEKAVSEDELVVSNERYHLRRYLFGIAEGQNEIARESALPMECNIDLASGIDFRKGCYIGQELTIRTKHTGVVRKRILPIQLYHSSEGEPCDDKPALYNSRWRGDTVPGTDIKQLDEQGNIKKGRAAGKFITRIGNVGLALCRLEMMTPMRVSAEGGSYKPGLEFGMQVPTHEIDVVRESEAIVKIKPIVLQDLMLREKIWWEKGRQKNMQ